MLRDAGLDMPSLFGRRIHLFARDPERDSARARAALAHAGIALLELAPRPLSMEDVFVYRVTSLERSLEEAA